MVTIPLLPLLYFQGKRIRKDIPSLPEAKGPQGVFKYNREQPPLRMLAIGESTVAGVGVEQHATGFTGTLAQELGSKLERSVQWRVYARSGYTCSRVTQKIVPKIEETAVDLIVVGLGGNDAFTLNRPGNWERAIQQLIDALQAKFPDTPLVFMNMPPIKEFPAFTSLIKFTIGNLVEVLGQSLSKVAAKNQGVYYSAEVITLDEWVKRYAQDRPRAAFFSDGVHPSAITYQVWAQDFATFVTTHIQL